ncbi:MAG: sigma-54-dependent Fis family transcriptional regulator [Rhodothalassiaceae bacterium]|nr:MAG: sigma-54-dependent Fis family transcriptional regulator [Rhodothalassiaceae bacterium]
MGEVLPARLLIVDDDADVLTSARLLLAPAFAAVETARGPEGLAARVREGAFDVVLLDMNFTPGASDGAEGLAALAELKALDDPPEVVMMTAYGALEPAVAAMKAGAHDFVVKPWENEKLLATMRAAAGMALARRRAERADRRAAALAEATAGAGQPLIARSKAMRAVLETVERIADSDASVLILGEHGVGKELVARAIHLASRRRRGPFIAVDLGAIPEQLFESTLFGHRKGAFTGAGEALVGRIVAADGGTLFLDELGNLPLAQQAKLLRVLETREVTPLGATRAEEVDIRVISATNLARAELADPGRLRRDLLYRLNTIVIEVPPLRVRQADILPIAEHYLAYYARRYGRPLLPLSEEARAALVAHDWPGNVRALRHAAERAVLMASGEAYGPGDFGLDQAARAAAAGTLDELTRQAVAEALAACGGNVSRAARRLGISRAALYRRMEKYGL